MLSFFVRALLLAVILVPCSVLAQLSEPIPPKSTTTYVKTVDAIQMPAIDQVALSREDQFEDQFTQPRRVAFPFKTRISMKDGQWTDLSNGDRIWQVKIEAPGAQAISLLYDQFYLPTGATMHVFNPKTGETIGAFTSRNNTKSRAFATALTYGDVAIVEYYEPAAQRGKGAISINQVGHAYRLVEVLAEAERAAMPAGACQVEINCSPEGDSWQNEKKGIARILINGSGLCTGSLINNTAQDGKPLFLTADHCIGSLDALGNNNASGYVFYWNYERTACGTSSTPLPTQTTAGATLRANDSGGDFALFELTEHPAASYDVWMNGYSAEATPAVGGVGIHHPAGDYKMIATHSIAPVSFTFGGRPADSYWNISWDATPNGHSVTEGGSSGSPLFDARKVVIGQLFGGSSINCSNPANDPGWYGKIAYNWTNNNNANPARRLNVWLDPVGGGSTLFLNGTVGIAPTPVVSLSGASSGLTITESSAGGVAGCRGYVDVPVDVQMNVDPGVPVTVTGLLSGTTDNYDVQLIQGTTSLGGGNGLTGSLIMRIFDDAEVENSETLILDLFVTGGGAAASATESTLSATIEDNDFNPGTTGVQLLFTETFDGGIPSTWSVANGGSTSDTWIGDANIRGNTLNGSGLIFSDSDAAGSGTTMDETITSPVIDVSAAVSLTLSFEEYFRVYNGGVSETATVEVLHNGAWIQVMQHTQAGGSVGSFTTPNLASINLTPYISNNFRMRFRYQAGWDWYWVIDAIKLEGQINESTAETVTAPFQAYLGPNQTVNFKAPGTSTVVAQVENLTSIDHGCVTAQIDRDASIQPAYPFFASAPGGQAFAKTLNLNPALSGTNGSYTIRYFMTSAEVAAWEAATGKTISEGGLSKVSGGASFNDITPANFASFVVDWQPVSVGFAGSLQYLESTFTTGFSAFGLSVNPSVPLPVELTSFTGAYQKGLGHVLNWETSAEFKSDRFEIERSADTRAFAKTGEIASAGTTTDAQSYTYVDRDPAVGVSYYRLRQVDVDGSDEYSSTISIAKPATEKGLRASFTASGLFVQSEGEIKAMILYGTSGVELYNWSSIQTGAHQFDVTSSLASGMYVLKATYLDGESTVLKLYR